MVLLNDYFRRQLKAFAAYHADNRNCVLHSIGIPMIFLSALTALALIPCGIGSVGLGTLLLLPAMLVWCALDTGIGVAMVGLVVPVAVAAEFLARTQSILTASLIAVGFAAVGWLLLFVGHSAYERKRPAFVDDISLMFIGPMFIVARICVALGFRPDLALLLRGGGNALSVAQAPGP